jgi:hypothetical protein
MKASLRYEYADVKSFDELSPKHAAYTMAGLGLRVFPVCGFNENMTPSCGKTACSAPGKHPLERGWQRSASTDRKKIEAWWAKHPRANLGVATGNGLVVLDVDPRNGGEDSFYEMQEQYGALPDTLTVATGGGGWHYYLRVPPGERIPNSSGKLGRGIDVKSDGGFVVGPGSLHLSGNRYDFEASTDLNNIVIAEAPPWLLERLKEKTSTSSPKREREPKEKRGGLPSFVPCGQRHDFLLSRAAFLRNARIGRDDVALLLWAYRERICEKNPGHPTTDEELQKILEYVFDHPKPRPHRKPGPSRGELKILEWLKSNGCGGIRGFRWSSFTVEEIACGVGLTERGTQKCIKRLEWRGLLNVHELKGGRNAYRIVHQE